MRWAELRALMRRMGGTHKFLSAMSDLYHFYGL